MSAIEIAEWFGRKRAVIKGAVDVFVVSLVLVGAGVHGCDRAYFADQRATSEAQTILARQEAANANARLVDANQIIDKLQNELAAAQPIIFSEEHEKEMIRVLSSWHGTAVIAVEPVGELSALGTQFSRIFHMSGWDPKPGGIIMNGPGAPGLEIGGDERSRAFQTVIGAFSQTRLKFVTQNNNAGPGSDEVYVFLNRAILVDLRALYASSASP